VHNSAQRCAAVTWSALQCVAVCCTALQYVAVCNVTCDSRRAQCSTTCSEKDHVVCSEKHTVVATECWVQVLFPFTWCLPWIMTSGVWICARENSMGWEHIYIHPCVHKYTWVHLDLHVSMWNVLIGIDIYVIFIWMSTWGTAWAIGVWDNEVLTNWICNFWKICKYISVFGLRFYQPPLHARLWAICFCDKRLLSFCKIDSAISRRFTHEFRCFVCDKNQSPLQARNDWM